MHGVAEKGSDSLQDITVAHQVRLFEPIREGERCCFPDRLLRYGVHLLQKLAGIFECEPELFHNLQSSVRNS